MIAYNNYTSYKVGWAGRWYLIVAAMFFFFSFFTFFVLARLLYIYVCVFFTAVSRPFHIPVDMYM